jgi:hypothetical protein
VAVLQNDSLRLRDRKVLRLHGSAINDYVFKFLKSVGRGEQPAVGVREVLSAQGSLALIDHARRVVSDRKHNWHSRVLDNPEVNPIRKRTSSLPRYGFGNGESAS